MLFYVKHSITMVSLYLSLNITIGQIEIDEKWRVSWSLEILWGFAASAPPHSQSWTKLQSWQSGLGNALAIWGTFLPEIYAGLSNFGICRDLRTFEIIFRLNVGKILNDWEKLGNIDLKILLFCLNFPPKFLYGSDWGNFLMNSVQ